MKKEKFKPGQIIAALKETQGMVYLAAKKLGCDHKTVSNYAKRYPSVQHVIDFERGQFVDTCELALNRAVLAGEGWAVCFALKTLGKKRGYVEKVQIENDPIDWDDVPNDILDAYCDGKLSDDDVRRAIIKQSRKC
jgi:hypothetical protein